MKTIGRKIARVLFVVLVLSFGFDGVVCTPVAAAEQTKQQKANDAAKKKRQQEAEKKKKEQAKAREKAAKQKAKSQAQTDKQREQAAKQKSQEAAKRQKDQAQAQAKKAAEPTREEAYALQVAEIEKYNAYVARYMSRDITHRVGFWGQLGYSNLLTQDIRFNKDNATGFDINAKGGVGGGGGVGYQMRYKRMLFTTGVEMQVYTSLYELSTVNKGLIERTFGMQPYAGEMFYTYSFANSCDKVTAGFVQLPVLFGMEFANKAAYFMAGPKVGLGVMGSSMVSGSLSTSIDDKQAVDPYQAMPSHLLVTDKVYSTMTNPLKWNLNVALYGEIGMSLDPWIKSNLLATRLGVFAEYGLLNVQSPSNTVGQNDQPVDYSRVLNGGNPVNDVAMVGSLTTTTATLAKVNPLLVGVKASVWFNLPRKQLRKKNLPKEPLPELLARVVHAETGKGLAGAVVSFASPERETQNKTTNSKGMCKTRLPKGEYALVASKVGYYDDSTTYTLERSMREDTIYFRLNPEPKPIVYTLAGWVYAQEDQHALEAEVNVLSLEDGSVLYTGETADDGLFVTNLLSGDYLAQIRCPGYMPLDDTVRFEQDTLSFYMTKIKEGVKVKINNLYFATNRTYILPQSEAALQDLTQFLLDNEVVKIRIIGHTDNVGTDNANQILSEGRANSLRLELIKRGVDANRITTEGRGEKEPIDTNDTEEGRQNNRRVEFVITDTGSEDIQQIY